MISVLDLHFQGLPGVIAAYLIEDAGEMALVEIGPTSTLDALLAALEQRGVDPAEILKILVTHVHLDHAGAAGSFIHHFPQTRLYVHEIGAPHLIDPSRLVASATRIYGERMEPLWGEIVPVPEASITTLTDGDTVHVGGTSLRAMYTPGHASHHVVFHDSDRDIVFTGDIAAVRLQGYDYVRPPTPPPDINLEVWSDSVQRVVDLRPRTLFLTHYGPFEDVEAHLQQTRERLYEWAELIRRGIEAGSDRDTLVDFLREYGDDELVRNTNDPTAIDSYELATPYFMTVDGLLRYFRKTAVQS